VQKKLDLKNHVQTLESQGFMVSNSRRDVFVRLVRVGKRKDREVSPQNTGPVVLVHENMQWFVI
jgi:hypothetical protein